MAWWGTEKGSIHHTGNWFPRFLILFFLYLMADTFLEDGLYGTLVTFISLGLSLVVFFGGNLGRRRDGTLRPGLGE